MKSPRSLLLFLAVVFVSASAFLVFSDRVRDEFEELKPIRNFVANTMSGAIEKYKEDMGDYPSAEEGLTALVTPPMGKEEIWNGPYLSEIPFDPWRRPFVYENPGKRNKGKFDLYTLGYDGVVSDDDIGNWEPTEEEYEAFLRAYYPQRK